MIFGGINIVIMMNQECEIETMKCCVAVVLIPLIALNTFYNSITEQYFQTPQPIFTTNYLTRMQKSALLVTCHDVANGLIRFSDVTTVCERQSLRLQQTPNFLYFVSAP